MNQDVALYKELVDFCNTHQEQIEVKFKRNLEFTPLNEDCYREMFCNQRHTDAPLSVKELKAKIPGLAEAYKRNGAYFMQKRNEYIKGLDIQKGQWYEKALQRFLGTKGVTVVKKGPPYPDFEVTIDGKLVGYYELKYIESPFLTANVKIKNTYPYETTRYDYEASLTLDTGNKMKNQRVKIQGLLKENIPVYYVWWYNCFHIKGIFAMAAEDVFDYYDHLGGDLLQRKTRAGDKETHQEVGKIYPPLLNMLTFCELISDYYGS